MDNNYKEQNEESHNKQCSIIGWCGITDVELARKIFSSIDKYIYEIDETPDDKKEYYINLMSKVISEYRSY